VNKFKYLNLNKINKAAAAASQNSFTGVNKERNSTKQNHVEVVEQAEKEAEGDADADADADSSNLSIKPLLNSKALFNKENAEENSDSLSKARKDSKGSKERHLKILSVITQKPRVDESSSKEKSEKKENQISISTANKNINKYHHNKIKNNNNYYNNKNNVLQNKLINIEIKENQGIEYDQCMVYLKTNKSEKETIAESKHTTFFNDKKIVAEKIDKKQNNISKESIADGRKKEIDSSAVKNLIYQSKHNLNKQNLNLISSSISSNNNSNLNKYVNHNGLNKNSLYNYDHKLNKLNNLHSQVHNLQNTIGFSYNNIQKEILKNQNNIKINNDTVKIIENNFNIKKSENAPLATKNKNFNLQHQVYTTIPQKILNNNNNNNNNNSSSGSGSGKYLNNHTDSNIPMDNYTNFNLKTNKNYNFNDTNNSHVQNKPISLTEENILMNFNHETPSFSSNLNNFIRKLTVDSNDYDDTNIMYPSSVLHTDPIENEDELMDKEDETKHNPFDLLTDHESIDLLAGSADASNSNYAKKNININIINGDYNKFFLNDNSNLNQNIISNLPNKVINNNINKNNFASDFFDLKNQQKKQHVKQDSNIIMNNDEFCITKKNDSAVHPMRIVSKISSLSDSSDVSAKMVNKASSEIESGLFSNFLNKNKDEKIIKKNQIVGFNKNACDNLRFNTEIIYDLSDYDIVGDNSNINNNTLNLNKNINTSSNYTNDNSINFKTSKRLFKNFNSNKLNIKSKYFAEKKIEDLKTILKNESYSASSVNNNTFSNKNGLQKTQTENSFEAHDAYINNNNIYENLNTDEESLNFNNNQEKKNMQNSLYVNKYLKTDESSNSININSLIQTHKVKEQNEKALKNLYINSLSIKNTSGISKRNSYSHNTAVPHVNIKKIIDNLKSKKAANEIICTNHNNNTNLTNINHNKNSNNLTQSIKKIAVENNIHKSNYNNYNTFSKKSNNINNNNSNNLNKKNNHNSKSNCNNSANQFTNSNLNVSKAFENKNTNMNFHMTMEQSRIFELNKSLQRNSTQVDFSGLSPSRNIAYTESNLKHEKYDELIGLSNNTPINNNIFNKKHPSRESNENTSSQVSSKKNKKNDINDKLLNSIIRPKNANNNSNNNNIFDSSTSNKAPNLAFNGNAKDYDYDPDKEIEEDFNVYNSKSGFKILNNVSSEERSSKLINTMNFPNTNKKTNNYSFMDIPNKAEKPKLDVNQSIAAVPQILKIEAIENSTYKIPPYNNISKINKRNNYEKKLNNLSNFELTFKNQDQQDLNENVNDNSSIMNIPNISRIPQDFLVAKTASTAEGINHENICNNNNHNNKSINLLNNKLENLTIKETENEHEKGFMQIIEEKADLSATHSITNFYNKTNSFTAALNNQNHQNSNTNKTNTAFKNSIISEHSGNSNNLNHSNLFNYLEKKNRNTNSNSHFMLGADDYIQNNETIQENVKKYDTHSREIKIRDKNHKNAIYQDSRNNKIIIDSKKFLNHANINNNRSNNNNNNNNTFNMFSHYYNLIHKNNYSVNNYSNNKSNKPLNFSNNSRLEVSNPKNKSESHNFNFNENSIIKNSNSNNNNKNNNNKSTQLNNYPYNNDNKTPKNKSDLDHNNSYTSNDKSNQLAFTESNDNNNNKANKYFKNLSNYRFDNLKSQNEINKKNLKAAYDEIENANHSSDLISSANLNIEKIIIKNTSSINFKLNHKNKSNSNNTFILRNKDDKSTEIKSTPINENKKNSIVYLMKTDKNINSKDIAAKNNKRISTIKKSLELNNTNIPNKSSKEIFISENPKIQFAYNTPNNNNIYNDQIHQGSEKNFSFLKQINQKNLTKSFSNSNFGSNEQKATANCKPHFTQNVLGSKIILNSNGPISNTSNVNISNCFLGKNSNQNNIYAANENNTNLYGFSTRSMIYPNKNFKGLEKINNADKNSINIVDNLDRIKNSINNINNMTNSLLTRKDDCITSSINNNNFIGSPKNNFDYKDYLHSQNSNKPIANINNHNLQTYYNDNRQINNFCLETEENNIYLNTQPNNNNVKINLRGDSKSLNVQQNQSALNQIKTKNVLGNTRIHTKKN